MLAIPEYFLAIPYDSTCYPGASGPKGLESGANCQRFAYELLRYFGYAVPDLRSSDLWEDTNFTKQVSEFEPLDLLLWNKIDQAWGAHVGVYLGEGKAIHISKKIGVPAIWPVEQFTEQEEYKIFIGAKRVLAKSAGVATCCRAYRLQGR
jgi:murein DD-endopeptidase / murein LD-carboxypeptidase